MKRIWVSLALCAALFATSSGHAAAVVMVVTDATGDANAINSQGSPVLKAADGSTPKLGAQLESMDIQNVKITTEFVGSKPSFVVVSLALGGDPNFSGVPHKYTIGFKRGTCNGEHLLHWGFAPAGSDLWFDTKAEFARASCADDSKNMELPTSKVVGKSVVFRIPIAEIGKKGDVLSSWVVTSRFQQSGFFTDPTYYARGVVDYAFSTKTYVIGS